MKQNLNIKPSARIIRYVLLLIIYLQPINFVVSQTTREVGNLVLQNIPETSDELSERLLQYQNTRSAGLDGWLPDGSGMLITTRFGNTKQFHIVTHPTGVRKQITFYGEPVGEASICPIPDRNGFLFTRDVGGDEFSQIFWYDMKANRAKMISDGESVNFLIKWSNEGNQFSFTSTRRNMKDFDVYISHISTPEEAELIIDRGGGYWMVSDWSPDDSKLIVVQYLSITKSNSFTYDLKTRELKQLNDSKDEATFMTIAWNRKGDKIYAITDKNREFDTLVEYDLRTKAFEYITDGIPWDLEYFAINSHRTLMAFTVNNNGFSQLFLLDTITNEYKEVPNIPVGQINALDFHPTKPMVGLAMETPQTPGDVYTLDLESFKLQRWTESEVGGLDTRNFPVPELITYQTFDKVDGKPREIPAFVYKPKDSDKSLPVFITIHGGPESQHKPGFSYLYTYLVNELGIAVIAPNVRGSSGYGKNYLKLDNGIKREESVKDIGALLDWIRVNPEFDEERVAVYGGSYGGYMVLASMVHFSDRLRCGIDVVGISNFVTFLENTEAYRRDFRRAEYGDERDPMMREFLHSISPTTNADEIRKPLFVIQGANDPRVPVTESEQMVKAIRENGGQVWYMLGKNEGHGFSKKENRRKQTEAMILFLETHLIDSN